jgi:hypothetical protein
VKHLPVACALFSSCVFLACTLLPHPQDFEAGMSRTQVISTFGEPQLREDMIHTGGPIFGPIAAFLPSVPQGSQIEIWFYAARGGIVQLYFVDGSTEVNGTGFAPDGVAF